MQNWNQWQLSAGAVATPMPQPPVGYAAPGADPMAMMQAYMQYYNQPAPSGYTAEQWAAAQQQNWAQWQQWQQQYQQWQAQYGEKYQETMKHMSAQNMGLANQMPQIPVAQPPPPLPKEDTKPPLPPTTMNTYQFTNMPPPHQNNLPLFPVKQNSNTTMQQTNVQNCPQNPPLPLGQPPLPPDSSNSSNENNNLSGKRSSSSVSDSNSAKKLKVEDEELTEAEKTFDAQFKQWEEQFNKWKQQNANHPDKTQYKQYEAKWTSWREKLIERREQMRRKREQQKQAAVKAEVEKNKSLPGDDKIMNILSSTENQGLINNLLGIGKTLGLTGKQNTNVPPPPPPPPATETAVSNVQTTTMASSSQATTQSSTSQLPMMNMMPSNMMNSSPWNSQQWAPQYNTGMNVPNFPNFQTMTGVPPPSFATPQTQMPPPNFTQPPPNFPAVPNFSQPPPGFANNDSRQNNNVRPPIPPTMQGRPPPFAQNAGKGLDGNPIHNERSNQSGHPGNFGMNDPARQKEGIISERFSRDSDQQGNQFRNEIFGQRSENERLSEADQFRREDRNYQEHGNSQFNQQKIGFNNDRFAPVNDRFGPGNSRFGPTNDRFGSGNDRFGVGNDRFGPGDNRFSAINDRFGGDRTGQGNESVNDRFGPNNDRFCSNNEPYGPGSDRFNRTGMDRFDQKDIGDNRRDSFPSASRGFNRNSQFEAPDKLAPELKKLMEKRRAAMDVFKPSFLESDKSSSVGSLSESFKKITGDSPFMRPTGNNFGPRGPPNFGPGGPSNFRMPGDFKLQGNLDFGPRGPIGIGRINSFDGGPGSFRGPNSSPQLMQDFINTEPRPEIMNHGSDTDINKENKIESVTVVEQPTLTSSNSTEQNIDSTQQDSSKDYIVQKDIPLLEKLPWIDSQLPEDKSVQNDGIQDDKNSTANYNSSEQDPQSAINESTEVKQELSSNDSDHKTTEVLPFMGENDPKPEDLNMEPPPELPNLGPVSTSTSELIDSTQRADDSCDMKESSLKSFASNPECFDTRGSLDSTFGPRGIQYRPNTPFLSPRSSNDTRSTFEPRGPNAFPHNPPGPSLYPLGPRGPNDGQFGPRGPSNIQFGPRGLGDGLFGPRGPSDGQFGPRGPNDGHFGPRGPNDGQFGPRGPTDGQFGPRGLNDGQFGPRGATDGQFGPRGINDGMFAPRGTNDGPFGPRGPTDNQFGIRGPNNTQFGPRGPNIGQFGPRFDGQLGLRRSNDGLFGPRGPNDGQFGSQGLNNRPFSAGKPNDAPFDNRGPCDSPFIPRAPNEGQSRFLGPNDRLFGSRRNEPSYQRNGLKGANDGQFPNRFNDKQFDNSTNFGLQGSSDTYFGARGSMGPNDNPFPPRGPTDRPFDNRQFDVKGIGEFRPKVPTDNSGLKVQGTSEGGDHNDPILIDKNLQQGPFDSNDMQNPGWRPPYSKNSFGDIDQRAGRDFGFPDKSMPDQSESFNQGAINNLEQRSPVSGNKSNMPDKRSERSVTDAIVGDYKAGYGESSSGCDYGKFDNGMHVNRLLDNRQTQVRCPPVKEFCIEKQFNYNHGEVSPAPAGGGDKKPFVDHVPAKVIDYAHSSKMLIQDHLTPVQCYDYGHGNLKPLVAEHEVYPKKDFRNWEENEQNLKEYTERIRRYEHYASKKESRRSVDRKQKRDSEDLIEDRKKIERDRREREDYKPKDRDERIFDRTIDKDHEKRYDKNSKNKERIRERSETTQKETNKENDKDEDRSKGNINWQENTNQNIIDTNPAETSVTDTQHNVLEPTQKTLELAKTPNYTMVDDLLCPPGRQNRPPKIAIILRGPPGSGKSFVAKLIKDKEVEQGGSAPRILSLDDYFLVEKEIETIDDNGKKITVKEMIYEYEEAMEQSYITSLVKAFKKNITDGFFNFIILDCINEKISDYEEMWSFAKTKGFKVYVCEMEMDLQICLKRNIHNRTEDEINRIIDYFEPTPSYHQKLDVNSMLQDQAIEEVHMEDTEETQEKSSQQNEDSQDSQDDSQDTIGVSKWERMEAEDKLDRLDGLAKKKHEGKVQTMKDFLQVPDYYNMEDTSGKKRVRWADLEERKEQEKMRAVGFVVGHTNWDRMMDPTKGGSALTRTKFFSLS